MKIFLISAIICFSAIDSFAGGWTLPKGRVWLKSAVFYQSTNKRFCTAQDALALAFQEVGCTSAGHSAPFDPFIGGEIDALAVFNEIVYGATGWLDLGVQIPFYSLQFTNASDPNRPTSNSIGDIRFFGKLRLIDEPFVASIRLGAKSPTGKFDIDAEVVNVSEGQWDFELIGEVGKSLWPVPVYFYLGVGYRIRANNEDFEHTMGNEVIALFEAGYDLTERVLLKGTVGWLYGERPKVIFTGERLLWRRELATITPAILYSPFDDAQLEVGVRIPFRGQDFPDGAQVTAGLSYQFSLVN